MSELIIKSRDHSVYNKCDFCDDNAEYVYSPKYSKEHVFSCEAHQSIVENRLERFTDATT